MRRIGILTCAVLVGATLAAPADADAQRAQQPAVTIEAFGGAADYGRFLEQAAVEDLVLDDGLIAFGPRVERELTAETGATFGGSIGIWPWEKTAARIGFTWSGSQLEFKDDTGNGSQTFDSELTDMNTYVLSAELLRFLFDAHDNTFAPYANAGVAAVWWSLDENGTLANPADAIAGGDETEFRFGGVGGLGLQIRLGASWATRLEVSTFGLGNPFDGDEGFRNTNPAWFTFDEPNNVRMTRMTVALTYSFLGDGPLLHER